MAYATRIHRLARMSVGLCRPCVLSLPSYDGFTRLLRGLLGAFGECLGAVAELVLRVARRVADHPLGKDGKGRARSMKMWNHMGGWRIVALPR